MPGGSSTRENGDGSWSRATVESQAHGLGIDHSGLAAASDSRAAPLAVRPCNGGAGIRTQETAQHRLAVSKAAQFGLTTLL